MVNQDDFNYSEEEEAVISDKIASLTETIYNMYLPDYLKKSWESGRGRWYEEFIREQLDSLVISETHGDPERLTELENLQDTVGLLLGISGASLRILDQIGMHLRGQTMGQYELLPEDGDLLCKLCQKFLDIAPFQLNPFYGLSK